MKYYTPKSNESTDSSIEYLRLKEGSYKVRILPPKKENGVWYVYDRKHFIKDKSGKANRFPCFKFTPDKPCLICEFKNFLTTYGENNAELKKLANSLNPNTRILVNAIDLADNKIKVLELPYTVFKDIRKYVEAKEDWGDILHPETGRAFTIERKGSGLTDTEYSVMPSPKQTPLPIEVDNDDLVDLEELVNGFINRYSTTDILDFIAENYEELYDDFVSYLSKLFPDLVNPSSDGNIDELDVDDDEDVEEI